MNDTPKTNMRLEMPAGAAQRLIDGFRLGDPKLLAIFAEFGIKDIEMVGHPAQEKAISSPSWTIPDGSYTEGEFEQMLAVQSGELAVPGALSDEELHARFVCAFLSCSHLVGSSASLADQQLAEHRKRFPNKGGK